MSHLYVTHIHIVFKINLSLESSHFVKLEKNGKIQKSSNSILSLQKEDSETK